MISLRWHAAGDVRLEDTELELPLGPAMVEVEVTCCGICGSDLTEYRVGPYAIREKPFPLSGQSPPVTLGHEFAGTVVAVGSEVTEVAVGDRVAADACWRCERCEACRSGLYNLCPQGGSIGLASDGGFAERVRFPAYAAVKLSENVTDRHGALLEPLAVGMHAIDRGQLAAGDHVVITGFGPIGAASALCARARGMSVLVVEPDAGRRARAAGMGLEVHDGAGDAKGLAREIRSVTGGGARAVLECSGAAAALEAAPDFTRRGGNVVVVGLVKTPPPIDAAKLVFYERSVIGALGYVNDLPKVEAMIASGALDPEPMITREIPLSDAVEEFSRLTESPGDDLKVLVFPGKES